MATMGLPADSLPKDRCTGQCCEEFHLPLDLKGIHDTVASHSLISTDSPDYKAWKQIADMVIYLGPRPAPKNPDDEQFHNYTCKHFDKEARVCRIYDDRPTMCKRHGTFYSCNAAGCTLVPAKVPHAAHA